MGCGGGDGEMRSSLRFMGLKKGALGKVLSRARLGNIEAVVSCGVSVCLCELLIFFGLEAESLL